MESNDDVIGSLFVIQIDLPIRIGTQEHCLCFAYACNFSILPFIWNAGFHASDNKVRTTLCNHG